MNIFIKGLIIGFSIAAPVGPIGILCIKSTLTNGWLSGFFSGLGAATADGFYGVVAAFGLTFISNALIKQQFWLHLIGGLFLLYLGIRTFLTKPTNTSAIEKKRNFLGNYSSTFFLTMTNPITILAFVAIFASLGLGDKHNNYTATTIVFGVFLGSAFWWLFLSSLAGIIGSKINARLLRTLNWISGTIIFSFGILALFGILNKT